MTKNRLISLFVVALLITGSWPAHARGAGNKGGSMRGGGGGGGDGGGEAASEADLDDQGKIRFGRNNAFGWELMSEEERTAHSEKMLGITTYDECNAYQEQHHKQMEVRAKEKGRTLSEPNNNACNRMKMKGLFK